MWVSLKTTVNYAVHIIWKNMLKTRFLRVWSGDHSSQWFGIRNQTWIPVCCCIALPVAWKQQIREDLQVFKYLEQVMVTDCSRMLNK